VARLVWYRPDNGLCLNEALCRAGLAQQLGVSHEITHDFVIQRYEAFNWFIEWGDTERIGRRLLRHTKQMAAVWCVYCITWQRTPWAYTGGRPCLLWLLIVITDYLSLVRSAYVQSSKWRHDQLSLGAILPVSVSLWKSRERRVPILCRSIARRRSSFTNAHSDWQAALIRHNQPERGGVRHWLALAWMLDLTHQRWRIQIQRFLEERQWRFCCFPRCASGTIGKAY